VSISKVARLREQIELECQAIQHMLQSCVVASHHTINSRYRHLDQYRDQLKTLVGEDQATGIVVDIYNQLVK
jgi:hypothetical protein